jgi:predicted transcriptional regulator
MIDTKKSAKKIILLGTAGVGKTTLKKIFFDSANPIELLCHQLEPTIGEETSVYHDKNYIAIHDLAGQEWDRWLKEEPHIFDETNLIICMIDAGEIWERNWTMMQEVISIQKLYCSNAICGFFFHKIDLLQSNEFEILSKKVTKISKDDPNNHYFLTSISPKYYDLTMKSLLYLFQNFIDPDQLLKYNQMLFQIEIMSIILKQGSIDMKALFLKLKRPTNTLQNIISYLSDHKIIIKESDSENFRLTEEGIKTLNSFRNLNKSFYDQRQSELYYFE